MDTQTVLEEYKKGDDGKRMSLFLAYRELRKLFSTIDQEASDDDFGMFAFPWKRKRHLAKAA
jgi:hypothetical protein